MPLETRGTWAGRCLAALECPEAPAARAATALVIATIYTAVTLFVVHTHAPAWAASHRGLLQALRWLIVVVFAAELLLRLTGFRRPWRYVASPGGVVDIAAVLPELGMLFLGAGPATIWLRLVRIARLVKLLHRARTHHRLLRGVAGRVAPAAGLAVAGKAMLLVAEAQPWWPRIDDLSLAVGAAGFAVSLLLGTKLGMAQSRLQDVEDAICRIAGQLRDLWSVRADEERHELVRSLDALLTEGAAGRATDVREAVRRLERRVPEDALDAAALHQDIELVIQRVLARTPPAYEQFLRHVALGYIAAIVFLEPGLTGLGATVVVVYVLGGMYTLVDAMDRAFVPGETLIAPNTLPLRAAVPTAPHLDNLKDGQACRRALPDTLP
jgi:hypothetical protein